MFNKRMIAIAGFFLLILAAGTWADSSYVEVSGAGEFGVDGTYSYFRQGQIDPSTNEYTNGPYVLRRYSGEWEIMDAGDTTSYYYSDHLNTQNPPSDQWAVWDGDPPAPSVTYFVPVEISSFSIE